MMNSDLVINVSSMRYPSSKMFDRQQNADPPSELIRDLSVTVRSGSFVSLLGPSGAGKTTLLRMIAGLERRYRGKIMLGDKQVLKSSREIQIVFQDNRLLPWKTVAQNIGFAMRRPNSEQNKTKIQKWIKNVDLEKKGNAWPKNLSGGEEGRVAFARTFVDPPEVLLLDEPFRNLDFVSRFKLQDLLLDTLRQQPMTVLMVSHSIEDALLLSDAVYVLSDSPMKVEEGFPVTFGRPRNRNSMEFRALVASIERLLRRESEPAILGNSLKNENAKIDSKPSSDA